jgi:hypothetical protein
MISPVSNATQPRPVQASRPPSQKPVQSTKQAARTDSVRLSSTAQTALKETTETAAETANNAGTQKGR